MAGMATPTLAQIHVKNNIQVVGVFTMLTLNGVLEDFLAKEDWQVGRTEADML
jgi:hypothetical protein